MALFLVTGGAGFIGSNIVKYLLHNTGHSIRVLDDLSSGKKENLQPVMSKIDFINGDIRDTDTVEKAVKGVDYVLHLAAIPSVPRSVELPEKTNDVNITGTLRLLIAARDAKVKRFVFSSSSSIYGDSPKMPKEETMIPDPISPYGIHKLTIEYYCRVFRLLYGMPTICLRYFNVFGPSQDPKSEYAAVIPKFITMILQGEHPPIFGDGEQTRDFTYVDNVVQANIAACMTDNEANFGQAFNIACGERISLNDLVREINDILGKNVTPVYLDPRPGDITHSLADVTKAKTGLKYTPAIDLRQGLEITVEWYKQKHNAK
ncbi:MAG: SDR family oxidoreductase [Candidatus Auribacter fodinae]|jgi:UDP-glucose 4-epimerase|uniref:SDR family oxidoreductase n=1 Tax=Candidatus Auribacter fodinae TaxID=2093366 RepID=A0A3A4R1X8_9BACT|nr:MAG: SDR family oxidoreductase [Candidatus Auribacter fodinae]